MVATSVARKEGRDISYKESKVATSLSGRDISYKEIRSRHQLQEKKVMTSFGGRDISYKENKVATSFSGHDISCKERRSRHHSAVATSDPRNAKSKSRPNKSFYDIAETTKVDTKNRGRDINNQMGQLT